MYTIAINYVTLLIQKYIVVLLYMVVLVHDNMKNYCSMTVHPPYMTYSLNVKLLTSPLAPTIKHMSEWLVSRLDKKIVGSRVQLLKPFH